MTVEHDSNWSGGPTGDEPAKGCCTPGRGTAVPERASPPHPAAASTGPRDRNSVVWLEGGRTYAGTNRVLIPGDGEERRNVRVRPFGIDRFAVTNARFKAFVDETGHRTEAERFGWSFVFAAALTEEQRATTQRVVEVPWWHRIDGATWREPSGPGSTIEGRMDHPVVHVGWTDAAAFAAWAGGRLLSEAEWEFAARGGRDVIYPWGDEDPPDDAPRCNNWQGVFPSRNRAVDGYEQTAPVDAFEPNGFGLYNMAGNCWEWCADAFRTRSLSAAGRARDEEARRTFEKVLKGGSYLCHRSYCHRYRIAARMGRPPDTTSAHIGFRIGYDA
jgi:formylglycine-generating enzyme required for sulfatase activity